MFFFCTVTCKKQFLSASRLFTVAMATDCDYVFADLLPDQGTVAVKVVEDENGPKRTRVIKHVMDDGKLGKERKERPLNSMSKNAIRIREKRKDPEYCKKENERRKLQRRQRKKKKEDVKKLKMRRIPPLSILFETTSQIDEKTGQKLWITSCEGRWNLLKSLHSYIKN